MRQFGDLTAVELRICKESDIMGAIQRLKVVALKNNQLKPTIRRVPDPTLQMAGNVTKNDRIPVYIQGSDSILIATFTNLFFEKLCEVRGCCYILAWAPHT